MSFLPASQADTYSGASMVAWKELNQLQFLILTAIERSENEIVVDDGTILTRAAGEITDVRVVDPGNDYSIIYPKVKILNTAGINESLRVNTNLFGEVESIDIFNGGSGFQNIVATISAPTGSGDAVVSPRVNAYGEISDAIVLLGGSGYSVGDRLIVHHQVGHSAIVEVAAVGPSGNISAITVVAGGQDYHELSPTITIDHPTGCDFEGSLTILNGSITDVTIIKPGMKFAPVAPVLKINSSSGAGAKLIPVVDVNGGFSEVIIESSGSGYVSTDIVTAEPTSYHQVTTPATFEIKASADTSGVLAVKYFNAYTGASTQRNFKEQIEWIQAQLTMSGYRVEVKTNGTTLNTLTWHIFW